MTTFMTFLTIYAAPVAIGQRGEAFQELDKRTTHHGRVRELSPFLTLVIQRNL
jgi:hypothetical protein